MTEPQTADVDHSLTALQGSVELADASQLARAGRYGEADAALVTAREGPRGLDLRARMAVQQGRHDEAARLWEAAADRLGQPGAFAAERRRLDRPRSPWTLPLIAVAAVAGLVVGAAVADHRSRAAAEDAGRTVNELMMRLDQQRAQDQRTDDPAAERAPSPVIGEELRARLEAIDGVRVAPDGNTLAVALVAPAFGELDEPAPALDAVDRIAEAVRRDPAEVSIVVTGYADNAPLVPGGRFRDNDGLALRRAQIGAARLEQAGLAGERISLRAVSGDVPGRTVTLHLVPGTRG